MRRIFRLAVSYFAIVGIVAHLAAVGAAYEWYRRSGQPLNLMVYDLVPTVEEHSPLAARVIQSSLFGTGLLEDPSIYLDPTLEIELPPWRGLGANKLRRQSRPRFSPDGEPVLLYGDRAVADAAELPLSPVVVDTLAELREALRDAEPGQQITLTRGTYRIPADLTLHAVAAATADRPIVLRGESIDRVVVEFEPGSGFELEGAFWSLTDLVLRGVCGQRLCSAPIVVRDSAQSTSVRNVFASDFATLVSGGSRHGPGVIEGVTLVGGALTDSSGAWLEAANRVVPQPVDLQRYVRICPDKIRENVCSSAEIDQVLRAARGGELVLLRAGTYRSGGISKSESLTILAEPGAHITEFAAGGKGAIVFHGGALIIDGLECSKVVVPDGNGTCVRHESGDLLLRGVHFHHSQMGILTGPKAGRVVVEDSLLNDSGRYRPGNLGHNIYVSSRELHFLRSWSLRAANQGHELKSRAEITVLQDCLLASVNSEDSRLVDAPNGGLVEIKGCILQEGPMSSNWDVIGFGLESRGGKGLRGQNRLIVTDNVIVSDRFGSADFIHAKNAESEEVERNILVGRSADSWPNNQLFTNRRKAGLPKYPELFRRPP